MCVSVRQPDEDEMALALTSFFSAESSEDEEAGDETDMGAMMFSAFGNMFASDDEYETDEYSDDSQDFGSFEGMPDDFGSNNLEDGVLGDASQSQDFRRRKRRRRKRKGGVNETESGLDIACEV